MIDLEKLPKTDESQAPNEEIITPAIDKEQTQSVKRNGREDKQRIKREQQMEMLNEIDQ